MTPTAGLSCQNDGGAQNVDCGPKRGRTLKRHDWGFNQVPLKRTTTDACCPTIGARGGVQDGQWRPTNCKTQRQHDVNLALEEERLELAGKSKSIDCCVQRVL